MNLPTAAAHANLSNKEMKITLMSIVISIPQPIMGVAESVDAPDLKSVEN